LRKLNLFCRRGCRLELPSHSNRRGLPLLLAGPLSPETLKKGTMFLPKIARTSARYWQNGIRGLHRLDERTGGWIGLLAGAARQALAPDSVVTAAAIAYFALFSLFPLTLLSIAIASFGLGTLMDQHVIVQRLEFIAPGLSQLLGKNIDEIIRARGPVSIIAFFGLIWSASTLFYMLSNTLNKIWGIKRRSPVWKQRSLAIIIVLFGVVPLLFLVSFTDRITANLFTWMPAAILLIASSIGLILAVLLDVALFMALYMTLPRAASGWQEIFPGAFAAGLLWEMAKKIFLFFISTYISVSNLVYGSVAAIIAILTWAYLSGLIFLFGANISASYCQQRREKLAAANQKN
jgi:membrane protein